MPRIAALAVFLVVLLCPSTPADSRVVEQETPFGASVRVSCSVEGGMARGCGVVIGDGKRVATAWHVVKDAVVVIITDRLGRRYAASSWEKVRGDYGRITLRGKTPFHGVRLYCKSVTKPTYMNGVSYWGRGHTDGRALSFSAVVYPKASPPITLSVFLGPGLVSVGLCPSPGMSGSGLFLNGKLYAVCSAAPLDGAGVGYGYWTRVVR